MKWQKELPSQQGCYVKSMSTISSFDFVNIFRFKGKLWWMVGYRRVPLEIPLRDGCGLDQYLNHVRILIKYGTGMKR